MKRRGQKQNENGAEKQQVKKGKKAIALVDADSTSASLLSTLRPVKNQLVVHHRFSQSDQCFLREFQYAATFSHSRIV